MFFSEIIIEFRIFFKTMAKVTRDQVNKINKECKNGFGLDIERLMVWGEKQLVKEIKNEDGTTTRNYLDVNDQVVKSETN